MDVPVRRSEFHIVNGIASGTVLFVPRGRVTIGSGEEANVQLAFSGVSRLHASLAPVKQRVIISDNGSRNGTWVNGRRISVPTEIVDGDLLQFGAVQVRFRQGLPDEDTNGNREPAERSDETHKETPAPDGEDKAATPKEAGTKPRESVGAAVLFAAVINVVGLVGNGATAFLTELTPTWSWFITPVVGLLIAVLTELVGHYRKYKAPVPEDPQGAPPRPRPRSRRLVPTILITVVLLGGGGWLVTAAVSTAVGYISGSEAGVERLEAPADREVQGIRVSILSVLSTPNFTRVEIVMRNQTDTSISVPLFQNCSLTADDGTILDADPFRSSWGTDVVAGGQRKGTINFPGQVSDEEGFVALSFSTIFGAGPDIPRSITVPNIHLAPVEGYSAR